MIVDYYSYAQLRYDILSGERFMEYKQLDADKINENSRKDSYKFNQPQAQISPHHMDIVVAMILRNMSRDEAEILFENVLERALKKFEYSFGFDIIIGDYATLH